ncbi:MAG: glycosyltransferase family 25 protein [Verrucomicrobia bacterium]|nr:glycosyltransferase family 25 protein [Verrucomicrobiota bacterium]
MKQLLLLLTMVMTLGYSALPDHFKKADGNPNRHSIRNVDFIYMINLDRRPEKWEASLAQLMPYGIEPYRFSAVNGWELTLEDINDVGVKFQPWMERGIMGTCYLSQDFEATHHMIEVPGQVYFSHCMSRGAIGIVLSHLSILQDAYDKGYETIWVMEDDVEVVRDPRLISHYIDMLDSTVGKNNWDILFTDQDTRGSDGKYVPSLGYAKRPDFKPKDESRFGKRKDVDSFRKIGTRFGVYSMIIRRSGIEKILNFYKTHNIFLPYDFEFAYPDDIALYTVRNDVVRHRLNAESDNGKPGYEKK